MAFYLSSPDVYTRAATEGTKMMANSQPFFLRSFLPNIFFIGAEALQQKRGTKDGEHLIVKTAAGGAELHSWSAAEDK